MMTPGRRDGVFRRRHLLAGAKLGIITNAGGAGVMTADALVRLGGEPARLEDETLLRLDQELPQYWSRANPIDILGDATPERYLRAVDFCTQAGEFDGLLIILTPQAMTDPTGITGLTGSTVWRLYRDTASSRSEYPQSSIHGKVDNAYFSNRHRIGESSMAMAVLSVWFMNVTFFPLGKAAQGVAARRTRCVS